MTARLPVFPLTTVLFPGLVLPLHIFEERYRSLIRELVGQTGEPREFGIVALRRGGEVETPDNAGPQHLHEVGCTAELRQVNELPDGRFDIVAVGRRRFRLLTIDSTGAAYLTGEVQWLPDEPADAAATALVPPVTAAFHRYLQALRPDSGGLKQVPDDPVVLSHLIAATAHLTLDERQSLLATPNPARRLRQELRLLTREAALLRQVRAVPVPPSEVARPANPN